jgi:hypothetical protein
MAVVVFSMVSGGVSAAQRSLRIEGTQPTLLVCIYDIELIFFLILHYKEPRQYSNHISSSCLRACTHLEHNRLATTQRKHHEITVNHHEISIL